VKQLLIILSFLLLSSFLISCEEETYVGERENGKYHGQGTLTFRDGDKYVGEFKDGKENGQGTYTWGKGKWEGHKYEGEWKDGKEHGQGTWTWSNGQKDVGEFRGDKHWNTTNYDKNGNILGKWVNGEWIKN